MKRIWIVSAAALFACPTAVWAAHGKAGLWNVTTTTNMAMAIPPEVAAKMKAAGRSMPDSQTMTSQICMTQAEVDADKPPTSSRESGCTTSAVKTSGSSMSADLVCNNGAMTGTGHMEIAYTGAEHYAGSNNFKGTSGGQPFNMSSTFKGDWVKADCGTVKPFAPAK